MNLYVNCIYGDVSFGAAVVVRSFGLGVRERDATCAVWSCIDQKDTATYAGFEPTQAKPSRFRIYLLNHSDNMSCSYIKKLYYNKSKHF